MVLLNQGHIVDITGRKRFDKNQLQPDGDLHKLLNYQGRKFDIKEVIGVFEKDENSQIIIQKSQRGNRQGFRYFKKEEFIGCEGSQEEDG